MRLKYIYNHKTKLLTQYRRSADKQSFETMFMKYKIYFNTLAVFILLFSLFFFAITVLAVSSNPVTTKVGDPRVEAPGVNPPSSQNASSCPIPQGVITCGSKNTPISGCGHCGVGYGEENTRAYCRAGSGNDQAIDISGVDFQEIQLPKLNGHIIKWTFLRQQEGTPTTQVYSGKDMLTGDQFIIQFHHTERDSGNGGEHFSGEKGGQICGNGCEKRVSMGHVHVQLASSTGDWFDATQYLCKGN